MELLLKFSGLFDETADSKGLFRRKVISGVPLTGTSPLTPRYGLFEFDVGLSDAKIIFDLKINRNVRNKDKVQLWFEGIESTLNTLATNLGVGEREPRYTLTISPYSVLPMTTWIFSPAKLYLLLV